MKRVATACVVLALFAACAGACGQARTEPDAPASAAPINAAAPAKAAAQTAAPTLTPEFTQSARARGYGEEAALVADGNGFSGRLVYPQGDVRPINRAIADWASATFYEMERRSDGEAADEDGMRATLFVDYDAYLYAGRFVGVKFTGAYRAVVSGGTEPVHYAYNYDLAASARLTLSDVIEQARMDDVRALVTERLTWLDATALSGEGMLTAAAMQDFVVRDDGIEWLFTGEKGVVGVLLEYATLAPYLCMEDPVPAAPFLSLIAADGVTVEARATCLHDGVQLYTMPSLTQGDVLATLRAGDTLDVLDADVTKGWHEVIHDGRIAFVAANLVRLDGADEAYVRGYVASAYLHVRSRASIDGELLGTMAFQEPVRVIDANAVDGWYRIWYEGDVAYVNARYVTTGFYPPETRMDASPPDAGEADAAPRILRETFAPIVGVGACTTEGVIVRSEPNTKADAFGTLKAGAQVYIMEEECAAGWDQIFVYTEANTGYIGYVPARYVLSFVPDGAVAAD